MAAASDAARAENGGNVPLGLRIAWGGGGEHADRSWRGTIKLSAGAVRSFNPLGLDADEPGSLWLEQGAVHIASPSPRAYDAVDLEVEAPLDAICQIELDADGAAGPPKVVEVPLRSILAASHSSALDEQGNRLSVARSPGDALHVRLARPSLVFSPGERFEFEIEPRSYEVEAESRLRVAAQLTAVTSGTRVWSEERELAVAVGQHSRLSFALDLPDVEGVYNLTLVAVPATRLAQGLALPWSKPLAQRRVQLVVVARRAPPAPAGEAAFTSRILEIDPANPRWRERLAAMATLPSLRKSPQGSGAAARWEHPKFGQLIQLAPAHGGEPSWEAYPLPISSPGQPHLLEVEYPSDVPQTLGVSIVEPNAAGTLAPVGVDSGVYVSDEEAEEPPQLGKHRLVFWPRTRTPLLVLTNPRADSSAVYGRLRVLGAAHRTFATLPLGRSGVQQQVLPRAFPPSTAPRRLLAGYFDRPLVNENFSASELLDEPSHSSLDDWTTFYQGATRLIEYLHYAGLNGAMLTVMADGSTIYPSKLLAPTPRHDTGAFFATGQDVARKDVLELLFRLFDREGLQLIPALDFAAPLPALEALKRAGSTDGLELVGADGHPWPDRNPLHEGLGVYYNALDVRVQRAMADVADELSERYAGHASFGGIAVQLSAQGYAQLPAGDWALDDVTVARFQRESGMRVPDGGRDRFAARARFLGVGAAEAAGGGPQQAWLQWRAAKLADFHTRLARSVARSRKGAKLYLAGATMLDQPLVQQRLRPALPRQLRVEDVLLGIGINTRAYADNPNVVLMRPYRVAPTEALAVQGGHMELNVSSEADELFAGGRSAALFYHQPQRANLPSLDAKHPFGAAHAPATLVAQMSPSGARNRRRFVHALAAGDRTAMFEGGWMLSLGQEESLHELVSVYRELPAAPLTTVRFETQPVTIRRGVEGGQTFVYLVNDSPWPVRVVMHIERSDGCSLTKLGTSAGVGPLTSAGRQATWTVELKPFDLAGGKFSSPAVEIVRANVTLPSNIKVALDRRIQDLGARARALGSPLPLATLENPGFDAPTSAGAISGWKVEAAEGASASVDGTIKQAGTQSVRLASSGAPVSMTSKAVAPPKTGRLLVSASMRSAAGARPRIRLTVRARCEGGEFARYGILGGDRPAASPLAQSWARYEFPVDDLPTAGLGDLSVQFELLSAGEVWIDDVRLYDLAFQPAERIELTKIITLAYSKLREGRVSDCARLLDGYWPQFLVTNVPLTQTPVSVAARPRPAAPGTKMEEPPANRQGRLERIRTFVPRFMRF